MLHFGLAALVLIQLNTSKEYRSHSCHYGNTDQKSSNVFTEVKWSKTKKDEYICEMFYCLTKHNKVHFKAAQVKLMKERAYRYCRT